MDETETEDVASRLSRRISRFAERFLTGNGESHTINYAYTLRTKPLSGLYTCCIHRNLLTGAAAKFFSDPFIVAGREWRIAVEAVSEHLSLFLVSLDQQPVEVSCTFDIVNRLDSSKIISKGGRKVIGPAGGMGFLKICAVNHLATPENGFLREDGFFVIELRLGLISSVVEDFTVDADESICICVWKLRCLGEMDYADIMTNDISTSYATWRLKLEPLRLAEKEGVYGAHLCCTTDALTEAKFTLSVLNTHDEKRSITREFVCNFPAGESSWGWSDFAEMHMIHDARFGFLEEGWITFIARISLLNVRPSRSRICAPRHRGHNRQRWPPIQPLRQKRPKNLCVVCLSKEQTSGFVHGKTSHKCVCVECCELLFKRNAGCPVCRAKVDSIVIHYF